MNATNDISDPTTSKTQPSEPPQDQTLLRSQLRSSLEEVAVVKVKIRRNGTCELTVLRGGPVPMRIAQAAFRDALGQLHRLNVQTLQLTIKKRAEDKLKETNNG